MGLKSDLLSIERELWTGGADAYHRARAVRGEGEDEERYHARVSSGYVDRDGQWKMAFHQQTPLSD